jgi:hypothetical protein
MTVRSSEKKPALKRTARKPKIDPIMRAKLKQQDIDRVFATFEERVEQDVTVAGILEANSWPNTPKNRIRVVARINDARYVADRKGYALSLYDWATGSYKLTKTDTPRVINGVDRRLRTGSSLYQGALMHAEWANHTTKDTWEKKYLALALEALRATVRQAQIVSEFRQLREIERKAEEKRQRRAAQ